MRILAVLALWGCAGAPPVEDTGRLAPPGLGTVPFSTESLDFVRASGATGAATLWRPDTAGPHPVTVFLPGAGVAPDRYQWVGEALASWGIAVAFPAPQGDFARSDDATGVLDALASDPGLDLDAVLLAGHSAGAVTQAGLTDVTSCPAGFCSEGAVTPPGLRGLALLGWHAQITPEDDAPLVAAEVPWLVLHGSADGLTTAEEGDASWARITDRPRHRATVTGMNHFQMTDDGPLPSDLRSNDDGEPGIERDLAHQRARDVLARFARRVLLREPVSLDVSGVVLDTVEATLVRPGDHGLSRIATEPVGEPGLRTLTHSDIVDVQAWNGDTYLLVRDGSAGARLWIQRADGTLEMAPDVGFRAATNARFGALEVFQDTLWVGVSSGLQSTRRDSVGASVWTFDGADWAPIVANAADADFDTTVSACVWSEPDLAATLTLAHDPGMGWAGGIADAGGLLLTIASGSALELVVTDDNDALAPGGDPCPSLPAGTLVTLRNGADENGFGDPWNKAILGMEVLDGRLYVATGLNYARGAQVYATSNGLTFERVWTAADHGMLSDGLPTSSSVSGMTVSDVDGTARIYLGLVGRSGHGARLGVLDANDDFRFLLDGHPLDQQIPSLVTWNDQLWFTALNRNGFSLYAADPHRTADRVDRHRRGEGNLRSRHGRPRPDRGRSVRGRRSALARHHRPGGGSEPAPRRHRHALAYRRRHRLAARERPRARHPQRAGLAGVVARRRSVRRGLRREPHWLHSLRPPADLRAHRDWLRRLGHAPRSIGGETMHTPHWMALALLVGCAGDPTKTTPTGTTETGTTETGDTGQKATIPTTCTETGTLCVTLNVPEGYAGDPREVNGGFYTSLPPAGPPTHALTAHDPGTVKAEGEIHLHWNENVPAKGDFHLYLVLYDKKGGTFIPEAGVDYVTWTKKATPLDGSALNYTLDLMVAE